MSNAHEAFAAALFSAIDRGLEIDISADMMRAIGTSEALAVTIGWYESRTIHTADGAIHQSRGSHRHINRPTELETISALTEALVEYANMPDGERGEWE